MKCEANGCIQDMPLHEMTDSKGESTGWFVGSMLPGWMFKFVRTGNHPERVVILCPIHGAEISNGPELH